jgi:hypothetical protein
MRSHFLLSRRKLDELAYALYGLTPAERDLVEQSAKN